MLNYFYFTQHFGDRAEFESEWADVLPDAQREAGEHQAQELILIVSDKNRGMLSVLMGRSTHSWFYRRDGKEWRKVRED